MEKMKLPIAVVLLLCLLAGCNHDTPSPDHSLPTEEPPMVSQTLTPPDQSDPLASPQQPSTSTKTQTTNIVPSDLEGQLNGFSNVSAVRYASDGKIAIYGDKFSIFDLNTQKVTAEMSIPSGWASSLGFFPIKDGYAVVAKNKAYEVECTYFDRDLNLQSTVNINQETDLDPIFEREVAVSKSGNLIAIADIATGLYIYDRTTKALSHILSYDDAAKVCSISGVAFSAQDQKISFVGNQIPAGAETDVTIYGSVKLDGSDLHTAHASEIVRLQAYSDWTLYSQDIPSKGASGKALMYYPGTKQMSELSLKEESESSQVWGSEDGKYIGTVLPQRGKGWTIRVYDVATGKTIYDELYSADIDQYFDPRLYIFEDSQIMIALLRPLGDNEQYKISVIGLN